MDINAETNYSSEIIWSSINNYSTINANGTTFCYIYNYNTINASGATHFSESTYNYATFTNLANATAKFHIFYNGKSGDATTNASFTNDGTANFKWIVYNYAGATFTNNGTATFDYDNIYNYGTFKNSAKATVTFYGAFHNGKKNDTTTNASFTNDGEAIFKSGGVYNYAAFTNNGTATFLGSYRNYGTLTNNGIFVEQSNVNILNNFGTINSTKGTFDMEITTNSGSYINILAGASGDVVTFSDKLTNVSGATFTNDGIVNFTPSDTFYKFNNYGIINSTKGTFNGEITTQSGSQINILAGTSGDVVTFNSALTNVSGATFTNNGSVNFVNGFENQSIINATSGTFGGTITTKSGSQISILAGESGDVVTFNNALINVSGASFTNNGSVNFSKDFTNYGIFTNDTNSTTTFNGVASFYADASSSQLADFTNGGTMTFNSTANFAKFTNNGTANVNSEFNGDIINNATLNANAGSVFSGAITNNKTINANGGTFSGEVTAVANSAINVKGNVKFAKAFTNVANASFNVASGGTADFGANNFTNYDTLANSGTITGAITNNKTINAESGKFNDTITTTSGSIINVNGSGKTTTFAKEFTNVSGATFNVESGATADFGANKFTNNGTVNFSFANTDGTTIEDFSAGSSLGKIKAGTFDGTNGTINVDLSLLTLANSYTFIEANITNLGSVTYKGQQTELYNYDCTTTKGTCVVSVKSTEAANKIAIHSALADAMGKAGISTSNMTQAIADTETALKSTASAPRAMLNAFKIDSGAAQLQGAIAGFMADAGTYYASASNAVMSDASAYSGGRDGNLQIFATPFGGAFSGDGLSGHLVGVSLGATYFGDNYIAQGSFAYANGSSTQDLSTQSNELSANLLQLGGFGRYFLGKSVEIDANVNFVLGMFDLENSWMSAAALNSSASFNDYEFNLGATGGYRFDELGESEAAKAFSVKPFVGLQLYYNNQGSYSLDSLGLGVDSVSDFKMDILAGAEARYAFKNGNFAYVKLGYEQKLFNTAKDISVNVLGASGASASSGASSGALTYDNEAYNGFFAANLGGRVLSLNSWRLDIEGVFKHYDSGLNYFGGNLSVKYAF